MVSSEEIRRRLEAKKRGETFSDVQKTPPVVPSTNICPQCQTPNPPTAKFCVGCGAPLAIETSPVASKTTPNEETIATSPGIITPPDYKLCPSCNQKNKLDAKFCIICGHKFEDETPGEKPLEPLTEVVGEKESPVTQSGIVIPPTQDTTDERAATSVETTKTPEEKTSQETIPEIKVPEQFKSKDKSEDKSEAVTPPEAQPSEESVPAKLIKEEQTSNQITKEESPIDEDPVQKIKKAKELLDIGAITQEEFDRIKNKYLDLI